MSDDVILEKSLNKYAGIKCAAKAMSDSGLRDLNREVELFRILHGALSTFLNLLDRGSANFAGQIHLISEDPGLLKNISKNFQGARNSLEDAVVLLARKKEVPIINKSEIIEGLSPLYHLVKPDTDCGLYIRSLIEKAFDALDLGKIPPAQFIRQPEKLTKTPHIE